MKYRGKTFKTRTHEKLIRYPFSLDKFTESEDKFLLSVLIQFTAEDT